MLKLIKFYLSTPPTPQCHYLQAGYYRFEKIVIVHERDGRWHIWYKSRSETILSLENSFKTKKKALEFAKKYMKGMMIK